MNDPRHHWFDSFHRNHPRRGAKGDWAFMIARPLPCAHSKLALTLAALCYFFSCHGILGVRLPGVVRLGLSALRPTVGGPSRRAVRGQRGQHGKQVPRPTLPHGRRSRVVQERPRRGRDQQRRVRRAAPPRGLLIARADGRRTDEARPPRAGLRARLGAVGLRRRLQHRGGRFFEGGDVHGGARRGRLGRAGAPGNAGICSITFFFSMSVH